jgi:hypothetical protein
VTGSGLLLPLISQRLRIAMCPFGTFPESALNKAKCSEADVDFDHCGVAG